MSLAFLAILLFNNLRFFGRGLAHGRARLLLHPLFAAARGRNERTSFCVSVRVLGTPSQCDNSSPGIVGFPRTNFILADVVQGTVMASGKAIFFILFDGVKNFLSNLT